MPSYEIGGDATVTITGNVVVAIAIVVDITEVGSIRRIRRIRLFPLFFLTLHLRASFYFAAQNFAPYFIVLLSPAFQKRDFFVYRFRVWLKF